MAVPLSGCWPSPDIRSARTPLLVLIVLMAATLVVALGGLVFDARVITGAPAWLKPAKFAISIIVYAATLWLLLPALADRPRLVRFVSWVVGVGLTVEMLLIALQAARGTASHFNFATPFDAVVFRIMGGTIMGIWLLTMLLAVLFFRRTLAHPALTWGVRLGFVGSVIGMGVAILMTFPTPEQQQAVAAGLPTLVRGAHAVGVADGGPGLPILGWSTTGGDLRVAHSIGLHALQGVPIAAFLLTRYAPPSLSARAQAQLVGIVGAVWIALTVLLTWQALRGQPLTAPDEATVLALVVIVVVAGVATGGVVQRAVSHPHSRQELPTAG
ncbi:MAG: hypothetical protein KC442_12575 [Thermomicrobiales bacterium]|nr:hypothetical protein [Thermomicrobiales bacterium]